MKKQLALLSLIAGTVAGSLVSSGAVPAVSDVVMTQDQGSPLVTITYDITDEVPEASGIVTLDILTNGVSIGAGNIKFVNGDVNMEVGTGTHTITWRPDKSWPGHKVTNATARVCVWDKSAPPDYMTVGLATPYEKKWYTCEAALPKGIESDYYRGDVLLMRRICQPKDGVWMMGSPSGEIGRNNIEALHQVTLTNDFWIGVFQVTQRQWELIKGDRPAGYPGLFRPVEKVSYDTIRGENAESHYPNAPESDSFLGKLRTLTGLSFDLPSEMQWEYACRAGTSDAYNNGMDSGLEELGRFVDNGGTEGQHARVGSYLPNAWGLYDMHGNVWEWCLDWLANDITGLNGQVNTTRDSRDYRVLRGGGWFHGRANCRSADRGGYPPSAAPDGIGFRLVCSAGL